VEEEQEETLLHVTQSKNVDMVKVKGKKEGKYARELVKKPEKKLFLTRNVHSRACHKTLVNPIEIDIV